MPPTRSRAKAETQPLPVSVDALSATPQMFLAQSARAALFGLDAFEANLWIWRTVGDALSEMGRRQQEAALQSMRERVSVSSAEAMAPRWEIPISAPFDAARAACMKVGDAVLAAQRRTLEAMSDAAVATRAV